MSRPTPLSPTQPAQNTGQPQFGKIPVTTWAPIAEVRAQIGEAEGSQASNWGGDPTNPTNRYFQWHSSRQEGTTAGSLVDSPYFAPGVASNSGLMLTVPKVEASPIAIPGDSRPRMPGTTVQPQVGPIPVSAWRAIPLGENNNPNLRSGGQITETRFFSRTDLQPVVAVSGPAPATSPPATSPQPILGPPRPIPASPPAPDVLASCECVAGQHIAPRPALSFLAVVCTESLCRCGLPPVVDQGRSFATSGHHGSRRCNHVHSGRQSQPGSTFQSHGPGSDWQWQRWRRGPLQAGGSCWEDGCWTSIGWDWKWAGSFWGSRVRIIRPRLLATSCWPGQYRTPATAGARLACKASLPPPGQAASALG